LSLYGSCFSARPCYRSVLGAGGWVWIGVLMGLSFTGSAADAVYMSVPLDSTSRVGLICLILTQCFYGGLGLLGAVAAGRDVLLSDFWIGAVVVPCLHWIMGLDGFYGRVVGVPVSFSVGVLYLWVGWEK